MNKFLPCDSGFFPQVRKPLCNTTTLIHSLGAGGGGGGRASGTQTFQVLLSTPSDDACNRDPEVPVFKNSFSHGIGLHDRKGGVLWPKWIWECRATLSPATGLLQGRLSAPPEDVWQAGPRGPDQPSLQLRQAGHPH